MAAPIMTDQITGAADARATLEAFVSVGAERFNVTYTELKGAEVHFERDQIAPVLADQIPDKLSSAAKYRVNIIIRPESASSRLIQLDDLSRDIAERLRPVAFIELETSPGNFQAWLALPADQYEKDWTRRLRTGTGADPNASGATRIAGSTNFKMKYSPSFPTVRLIHTAPGLITNRAALESMALVAPDPPVPATATGSASVPPPLPPRSATPRAWPSYQRCLLNAPLNGDGTGFDRSRADFTWCMIAIDWGWRVEETADCLMSLSEKAQENGRGYAGKTAHKAADAVYRRARRN